MNALINAINENSVTTENGMPAYASTMNDNLDLFFKVGSMRGQAINPLFSNAFAEDVDLAVRTILWARDVRGGAGERQIFRDALVWLAQNHADVAVKVVPFVSELGRWDDMLVLIDSGAHPKVVKAAVKEIKLALSQKNGLCAKWMPRKGKIAAILRCQLGLSPKQYRKILVGLSDTIETKMCQKQYDEINYSHVPSVAMARYRSAFSKNDEDRFRQYLDDLKEGKDGVKINAGSVFPHDILRGVYDSRNMWQIVPNDNCDLDAISEQWKALPDYVGDSGRKVMPVVDVSGSMCCDIGAGSVQAIDIALALGLYFSERNVGPYKDCFVTFSHSPKFHKVSGNIQDRVLSMANADWAGSTDVEAVFNLILNAAKKGSVSQEDMPTDVLILSDMQFNHCTRNADAKAIDMIRDQFKRAGYTAPNLIFWNIRACDNVPVKFDEKGSCLISGYSPAVLKNVLSAEDMSPMNIMLKTIGSDRYNWNK